MASSNLGRVQGGGFFGSSATSTTSITKTTVQTNGVSPLVGDTIVNANGDLCRITAVTSTAYSVSKYASIKGATGPTGSQGATGPTGPQGPTGSAGSAGANGATWTTGTSTPSNSSGSNGDLFLNTSTYDIYKKSSGAWSKVGNIKGATGPAPDTSLYALKNDLSTVATSGSFNDLLGRPSGYPIDLHSHYENSVGLELSGSYRTVNFTTLLGKALSNSKLLVVAGYLQDSSGKLYLASTIYKPTSGIEYGVLQFGYDDFFVQLKIIDTEKFSILGYTPKTSFKYYLTFIGSIW